MKIILQLIFLGLIFSCAPSGTESDSQQYHQLDMFDNSIKQGDEAYYINLAYEIGALGHDSVGDYETALLYTDSAILVNPQSSKAYRYKAYLYSLLGKQLDALSSINQSLKIDSLDTDSYFSRANILIRIDERDKALLDYYKVFTIDSLNGMACECIGYMEYDKGNEFLGCEFLERARTLGYNPEHRWTDSIMCN